MEELDVLSLQTGELAALEQEQNRLANAEEILEGAHQALELCDDQETGRVQALNSRAEMFMPPAVINARNLLESTAIQLGEACSEIQRHIDSVAGQSRPSERSAKASRECLRYRPKA